MIRGIKKVTGESKRLRADGYGHMLQIAYDPAENAVFSVEHVDGNSMAVFGDPDIVTIGYIRTPITMAKLREMIKEKAV